MFLPLLLSGTLSAPVFAQEVDLAPVPTPVDYNLPDVGRGWRNHLLAAGNVTLVNYLVWQFNWLAGEPWANVRPSDIRHNFQNGFTWDTNQLGTNFFAHPYHGSVYWGAARGAGLSFWESVPYTLAGSLAWELFAETEQPSINDLIATTAGGMVLGESMYRLAGEVLDDSAGGVERVLREVGAGVISPARGVNRLFSGQAWHRGPAGQQRGTQIHLDLGLDRVSIQRLGGTERFVPSILLAVQMEYGELASRRKDGIVRPFDFFDLYVAANFADSALAGSQAYAQGVLRGWSQAISTDTGALHDNNVLALVQSFDYQGANIARFGGMGVGLADYLLVRIDTDRRLRLGVDVQWNFLTGVTSPVATQGRDYNMAAGLSVGVTARYQMGRWGELQLRAREFFLSVVSGARGNEFIGYARLAYEVDIWRRFGVGISPNLINRRGRYDTGTSLNALQLEAQVYLRWRP